MNKDEFLNEVIEIIYATGQISSFTIQRRFKVGYSRACDILKQLEDIKIIKFNDKGTYEVLISKQELKELLS